MERYEHLPHAIKARRVARNWSQETLARLSGIHIGTIRRLEDPNAKLKTARQPTLQRLARGLGCDLHELAPTAPVPPREKCEEQPTFALDPRVAHDHTRREKRVRRRKLRNGELVA